VSREKAALRQNARIARDRAALGLPIKKQESNMLGKRFDRTLMASLAGVSVALVVTVRVK